MRTRDYAGQPRPAGGTAGARLVTIGLFVALLFLASIGADMLGALVGLGGSNGEAVILLGLLVLVISPLGLVGIDA